MHSHILYAYNIMILCRGDLKSTKTITNLLKIFTQCSGQNCSSSKSLIFFGVMHPNRHKMLVELLGFTISYPPFIYLGHPIFIGRPKNIHFQFIVDIIRLKIAAWKASLISW